MSRRRTTLRSGLDFPCRQGLLGVLVGLGLVVSFSRTCRADDAAPGSLEVVVVQTNLAAEVMHDATNHLGWWIWEQTTTDKQTCRLWKSFVIPPDAKISGAILRITVDNGYTLFLDGRELGRGSDWRTVTEYDITRLLNPGRHVLAVDAFNDRLQAGLIFGLDIQLMDENRTTIEVVSDNTWRIVPPAQHRWLDRKSAPPDWPPAVVVGSLGQPPWAKWPIGVSVVPPLLPLTQHFWQSGWFQLTLLTVCAFALLFCLWLMTQLAAQSKAQHVLQVERARIARDIHDDLGAQLTPLVLQGEVAQREHPADSAARAQFNQFCERGREISRAMGEVVWAVNSRRDTVRDFVSYVCKYAQTFLAATSIRCRLEVEPEIPPIPFDLPVRRNLFLAVKEALNNAARHSAARELFLRIHRADEQLIVIVEDNGRGFDPAQAGDPPSPSISPAGGNGLPNMVQRMSDIGGDCNIVSAPGAGCLVTFAAPLAHARPRWWHRPPRPAADPETLK